MSRPKPKDKKIVKSYRMPIKLLKELDGIARRTKRKPAAVVIGFLESMVDFNNELKKLDRLIKN